MRVHDRTPFPAPVGPDKQCIVPVLVLAPARSGGYELGLDVVHEHVRWFDCETRVAMDVTPLERERLLICGSPLSHRAR